MDLLNKEPGLTGAVGGVGALTALAIPLNVILLELGASAQLASALTTLILWAGAIAVAFWARSRTVPQSTHDTTVDVALDLPAGATKADLKRAVKAEEKAANG